MARRKPKWRWGGALVGALFAAIVLIARAFDVPFPFDLLGKTTGGLELPAGGLVRVTEVVDGDTIKLAGGTRVRYVAVDTPERKDPYWAAAKRENARLTMGKDLRIETCAKRGKDDFGRALGTPFDGERDVALELVRLGLGRVFVDRACMSPDVIATYFGAAVEAFGAQRGIWKLAPDVAIPAEDAADLNGYQGFLCGTVRTVERKLGVVVVALGEKSELKVRVTSGAAAKMAGGAPEEGFVGRSVAVFGRVENDHGPTITVDGAAQWKPVEDCRAALRP